LPGLPAQVGLRDDVPVGAFRSRLGDAAADEAYAADVARTPPASAPLSSRSRRVSGRSEAAVSGRATQVAERKPALAAETAERFPDLRQLPAGIPPA